MLHSYKVNLIEFDMKYPTVWVRSCSAYHLMYQRMAGSSIVQNVVDSPKLIRTVSFTATP